MLPEDLLLIVRTLNRYKNGKALAPSDTVRITSDGNRHKLVIAAIVKSDEGEYIFEVSSSAGSASCSATLAIQGGCVECLLQRVNSVMCEAF